MGDGDCVFCRIIEGTEPATFVWRDEHCSAFMDIQPVNPGHLLVVPNRHATYLADTAPEDAARMMVLAQRLAAALRRSGLPCEGVNLFIADGEAAMQEIMHVHLHVFPRFRSDGFGLRFPDGYFERPERAELEASADRLRAGLGS